MTREPLALADIVRLALMVAVSFGLGVTQGQVDAIVALVAAVAVYAAGLGITAWLRARLTPVAAPKLPAGTRVVVTDPAAAPGEDPVLGAQTLRDPRAPSQR